MSDAQKKITVSSHKILRGQFTCPLCEIISNVLCTEKACCDVSENKTFFVN